MCPIRRALSGIEGTRRAGSSVDRFLEWHCAGSRHAPAGSECARVSGILSGATARNGSTSRNICELELSLSLSPLPSPSPSSAMSFNATFISPKAVQPTSAELYAHAGVDYASLSTVEQWWVDWYLWIADPMIATGLMSFVLHEVRPLPFPTFVGTPWAERLPRAARVLWPCYSLDNY
jgi:hypothetical protein